MHVRVSYVCVCVMFVLRLLFPHGLCMRVGEGMLQQRDLCIARYWYCLCIEFDGSYTVVSCVCVCVELFYLFSGVLAGKGVVWGRRLSWISDKGDAVSLSQMGLYTSYNMPVVLVCNSICLM